MIALIRYLLGAIAICAADILTSSEITLWIAYLVPIGMASWNLGRSSGYAVALACAVLHLGTWIHDPLPQPGVAAAIVLTSRLVVFALVVALVSALRKKEVRRLFHPTQSE